MKAENLTEEVIEQIAEINKEIRELKARIEFNLQEMIEELEYRRSLGEDI